MSSQIRLSLSRAMDFTRFRVRFSPCQKRQSRLSLASSRIPPLQSWAQLGERRSHRSSGAAREISREAFPGGLARDAQLFGDGGPADLAGAQGIHQRLEEVAVGVGREAD